MEQNMPIYQKPYYESQFHTQLDKVIELWKKDPNFKELRLKYSYGNTISATISYERNEEIQIPLPTSCPKPYRGWKEFMSSYLENEVRIACDAAKIKCVVWTNLGHWVPLLKKEL